MRAGSRQRTYLRGARTDSFEIVTAPQRSKPAKVAGIACRLRAEIATAFVLLLAWLWLAERMPAEWAGVVLGAVALVVAVVPHTRRFVWHRALAVESRHRLRAVLVLSLIHI